MPEEQEDKYERFFRWTDIDLQADIAAGGDPEGLVNYYTKTEADVITDALDVRITDLENAPPGGGVTDHGALTGLTDDDHPQYHTNARGDDRYYTKTQTDANYAPIVHTHSGADITSGQINIARIPTGQTVDSVSLGNHNHDDRYYTESEIDTLLGNKAPLSDTPRYLMFNVTWPVRPADSRMTFYIGGDPATDAPTDSVAGDVWIPASQGV